MKKTKCIFGNQEPWSYTYMYKHEPRTVQKQAYMYL